MEKFSKRTERKAYWLFKQGKVKKELETDKRIHFSLKSEDKEHFVIFDKKKNEFTCDCYYFSLHQKNCSHILASKMWLKEQKDK
ncbi:MAG: hypothetical protein QMD36_01105 [Candidatus Aenigmarchaeota archaeon]|nr:hypothetical protein [Candidatus Aenigmarchaeota archaeon]